MTQARRQLVDPTHAGTFHYINRCVRRSWLCGEDEYTGRSFEHRKRWVEKRILELGDIFSCGIYAWAVMSNHLHIVVHMSPQTANAWTTEEVANRWVKLYQALSSPHGRAMRAKSQRHCRKSGSSGRISIQIDEFVVADEIYQRTHCPQSQCTR